MCCIVFMPVAPPDATCVVLSTILLFLKQSEMEVLDRVLLYCKATAGRLMIELHKLSNDNFFLKAGERV